MEMKDILARNLLALRKARSLTQLELAEELNYSDKSVSKWEHGDAVPDIEVLARVAEFYGVTVDYLICEHAEGEQVVPERSESRLKSSRLLITLLAASVVWLVATLLYVVLLICVKINFWNAFVWAVPASCIVLIVFNAIWGRRKFSAVLTSVLVWSLIAGVYLQTLKYNMWALFFIGIPLQISVILWARLKSRKHNA